MREVADIAVDCHARCCRCCEFELLLDGRSDLYPPFQRLVCFCPFHDGLLHLRKARVELLKFCFPGRQLTFQ